MTAKQDTIVTLQDIADKAGCSRNTASLAMRNSSRISEAMRDKIQSIASRLGYVPNLAARNLITRRSGMIGIYARAVQDAVRSELIESLLAALHTAEYRPVLGVGSQQAGGWSSSPWMGTFQEMQVEALVVICEARASFPQWNRQIPCIYVGNEPDKELKADYVALSRAEGASLGVQRLVQTGHQRILVASAINSTFGARCVSEIQEAGAIPMVLSSGLPRSNELVDAAVHAVRTGNKPSAVIFGDSPLAVSFLHKISELGIRCPDDLAVIGYDYFPWADMLQIPLTTIEQPISKLAAAGSELVKFRLANREAPLKQIVLQHKLVIRKSG
jgi:LacI family transcriptional regulator